MLWLMLAAQAAVPLAMPPPTSTPAPPAFPAPVAGRACPATFEGRPLSGGAVYDGPPADNVILKEDRDVPIPGGEVAIWPVGILQRDFHSALHLGCLYGDSRVAVVVRVIGRVETCRAVTRGARQTLGCR